MHHHFISYNKIRTRREYGDNKLPVGVKLGMEFATSEEIFFSRFIGFWLLNFLTDTVGLAAGLAGLTIAIGRYGTPLPIR